MILLDNQTELSIKNLFRALYSAWAVYNIGRELGQSFGTALNTALGRNPLASRMTFLEQSFLAGKVAQTLGTNELSNFDEADLIQWIRQNNVTLSDEDVANLASLRSETERWLEAASNRQQARLGVILTNADREWRAALTSGRFTDARARTVARNAALNRLQAAIQDTQEQIRSDATRQIETEINNYFQHGQTSGLASETLVYKIPRASACQYCLNLHLEPDGSPKIYKLDDLRAASNFGVGAYAWQAVIGSTHPHCYCQLYTVEAKLKHGSNQTLAEAREKANEEPLRKALTSPARLDPGTSWEEPVSWSNRVLLAAMKQAQER